MSDAERHQAINRAIMAAPLYIGLVYAATVAHELTHWLFIVPPGGSLSEWRPMPPGWEAVTLSGTPLDSVVYFAGGFGSAIFLGCVLIFAIIKVKRTNSLVWWWVGLATSFAMPMQITAGIFEGAINDLYRGPVLVPIALGVGIAGIILYGTKFPFDWPPDAPADSAISHEQQEREQNHA